MKLSALVAPSLVLAATLLVSGCAVFQQGRKQTVIVRSTPSGAVAKINGIEVGTTPFKVRLQRDEVFRIDLSKNGFAADAAIILPSTESYEERFVRWGVDYSLGSAFELIPNELQVELKPAMAEATSSDPYVEFTAQISRADALLASGELTPADHKYLVSTILAKYKRL